MTGLDFQNLFYTKWGKAYSGYYDTAKLNRLTFAAIQNVYQKKLNDYQLSDQVTDELSYFISVIPDAKPFNNLLTLSNATNVLAVSSIAGAGTVTVTTTLNPNGLVSGQQVKIQGLSGYTINGQTSGTFVITVTGPNTFTLNNATGAGVNVGTVTATIMDVIPFYRKIKNIQPTFLLGNTSYTNFAWELKSIEKGAVYGQGTVRYPKYEVFGLKVKLLPSTTATNCVFEYFVLPTQIDTSNNTTELPYTDKLLTLFVEELINIASQESRDNEMYQMSTIEVRDNP